MNTNFEGILATDENMPMILMAMEVADDIAVDTETSGTNVRNGIDYLMGICIDTAQLAGYIPIRHEDSNVNGTRWLPQIHNLLKEKPLLWHNRKFDMHSFKTVGIDPLTFKGPQYDSMVLASLVDEELFSKEMDFLSKRFLNEEKADADLIKKLWDIYTPAKTPAYMYRQYGSWDAVLTRKLRDFFWPRIVEQGLESVYWDTEAPFTELLYVIEQRGVGVNTEFASNKARLGRAKMATIQRELGYSPASPIELKRVLLDELGLPVFAHTDSCKLCGKGVRNKQPVDNHEGPPSFNKAAMEDYDEILEQSNNPTAKLIAEYRGWQKATTALYEPLLEKVGPDGRIRTEFHQHRTLTGRLSSSNPNLQQIPRSTSKPWNGDAKNCFNAGLGSDWALYGWDYSQIELRLAAAYGNEALLLTEFESEDADPFSVYAPIIFGSLTPETRHYVKNGFFYPTLYGAGLTKITAVLGKPEPEVRILHNRFKDTIPGIIRVSKQIDQLIKQRGWVRYWDGRRRHIKDKSKSYKGFNSVCQGGSAQLMKQAMLRCRDFENPEECFMVLSVHDEITFCIKRDLIPKYEPLIIKAMTDFDFGVNLHVEGKEWH